MARKKDKEEKSFNSKKINGLFDFIKQGMNSIYADTYQNSNRNRTDIDDIRRDIDDSISAMTKVDDENINNISNITRLYSRMKLKNDTNSDEVINGVLDIFNDKSITDNILSSYMENKYILDYDNEIDTVCKYMPKMEEALDAKKDSVLSADHFSKEFISVKNTTNTNNETTFNKRIEEIKKTYKLHDLFEELYDGTARYGERFVYIVPYKQALSELLKNNNNALNNVQNPSQGFSHMKYNNTNPFVQESVILENGNIVDSSIKQDIDYSPDKNNLKNLSIVIDKSGILESAVLSQKQKVDGVKNNKKGIYESYIHEISQLKGDVLQEEVKKNFKLQNSIDNDLELPEEDDTSNETIINKKEKENVKIDVAGCIVKVLPRENVIPVYVDRLCLGYYYLEFQTANPYYNNAILTSPKISQTLNRTLDNSRQEQTRDQLISNITAQLSKQLDANFINTNQDLRKEIYMILKHNDLFNNADSMKIKVTFLPESDVVHMKFKTDQTTHRGISDLQRSLLPAKLFACLYITNTIGILTRGNDKRVYYVKQSVETNISKTMLNVIAQIKQSNFGLN